MIYSFPLGISHNFALENHLFSIWATSLGGSAHLEQPFTWTTWHVPSARPQWWAPYPIPGKKEVSQGFCWRDFFFLQREPFIQTLSTTPNGMRDDAATLLVPSMQTVVWRNEEKPVHSHCLVKGTLPLDVWFDKLINFITARILLN